MSLVSFVLSKNSIMENAIEDSLDLINYKFSEGVKTVVIKPNMCYYWDYSTGQTTDPNFVASVIEIVRKKTSPDVDILIVESDASAMRCKYVFKFLGYQKMAERCHVKLVNLSEVEAEQVKVRINDQNFDLMVPRIVKSADLRINIPKMKFMGLSTFSCALKNVYGCNPYLQKFKYHTKLSETIVALNKTMPFDLCLLDGIVVSSSQVSKLGLVMASQDPVAMDSAAARIMKVNPKSVKYIALAKKEGLGKTTFIAKGMDLNYFRDRYPKRNLTDKAITLAFKIVRPLGLEKRLMLY